MSSLSLRSGRSAHGFSNLEYTVATSQGRAFWTQCLIQSDVIGGLQCWSDNPSGSRSVSGSTVDSFGSRYKDTGVKLRPCFIASYNPDEREVEIFALATFGRRKADVLDPLTQHFAISVEPTPAFPADASCARTSPQWSHSQQYLILTTISLPLKSIHKPYKKNRYKLEDIEEMIVMAQDKTNECAAWNAEQKAALRAEWERYRKRLKKAHRKRMRASQGLGSKVTSLTGATSTWTEAELAPILEVVDESAVQSTGCHPTAASRPPDMVTRRRAKPQNAPEGHFMPTPAPPSGISTTAVQPPAPIHPALTGTDETHRNNKRRSKKRLLTRLAKLNPFGGGQDATV